METETAYAILGVIAGVGAVAWLSGLTFLLRSFHPGGRRGDPRDTDLESPGIPGTDIARGSVEVEGDADDLVRRASAALASNADPRCGQVKILECRDDRLVFEGTGYTLRGSAGPCYVRRGEMTFSPQRSGKTEVSYTLEVAGGRWLFLMGAIFLALGLVALITLPMLLALFVANHPNPGVRGQSLQAMQMVHLLWPPFLVGGLYRVGRRGVIGNFEVLLHNLPYRPA